MIQRIAVVVDSSGKIPNGVMAGTAASFGHFDQCLAIEVEGDAFRGKFCTLELWLRDFPRPSTNAADIIEDSESEIQITANVTSCQVKEPISFSQEQLIVLCILGVLLLLAIVGTGVDVICIQDVKRTAIVCGRLAEILASFSLVRNTRSLFGRSEHATGPLEALNGIRVISCFWIVLGHIYFLTDLSTYIRFASLTKLQVLFKDFLFTLVENFTLPVDTFFFITMTPAFGLATALFVLMPAFGSGPMWGDVLGLASENCRLYWWTNLLYFSNYLPYSKMCMLHSWFLSLNMQYFVIGLPLALMMFSKAKQLLNLVYYQPFTHFGPFAIGLCFGYTLPTVKVPRFGKVALAAGWLMAIVLCGSAVFVAYPFRRGDTAFHPLLSAAYAGCHRTLWTIGIAWVTLLCATQQAGLVGEMLSSSAMTPLSRLSYLVFLLHPVPIYVHVASVRESFQLDHYYMCTLYFGILVTSILMAYVAYLTVEAPFTALERLMRSPPKTVSDRVQTPLPTFNTEPLQQQQQQQQQQQNKEADGWRSPKLSAPAAAAAALNGGNSTLSLAIAKTHESSHL
ncbi:hypothetical protein HPB52_006277 [Rhipicephalus sanguineus]|uniref:Nose resistant-to-fluoxetine protein N-terminal domain-containing protein n=1 Tax=Rhipicephalus sanguineus TaxID=34632 RepID=A0A9D4QLC8_RHISA|nr:hypothetical protein HPB52_006277 [Rhipicephalus sanguineus]